MLAPFQILVGIAAAYLAATVSEACLHRFVGHASGRMRRLWGRYPGLCGHLQKCHYRHAVVHHGLTFRRDHVTQFVSEEERAEVDRIIQKAVDGRIQAESYGLSIGLRGLVTYNLTVIPFVLVLSTLAGPWTVVGALPVLTLAPLSAMLLHPYLHQRYEVAIRKAPAVVRLLLRSRYIQAVWRHHFLHHRHPNHNFNLLLGGDFLLRTHRAASVEDLRTIEVLGLDRGRPSRIGTSPDATS